MFLIWINGVPFASMRAAGSHVGLGDKTERAPAPPIFLMATNHPDPLLDRERELVMNPAGRRHRGPSDLDASCVFHYTPVKHNIISIIYIIG